MRIGIIGSGRMGSGLGRHWVGAGHDVFFGGRDLEKVRAAASALGPNVQSGSIEEAAAFGEVVVLAIPWKAALEVLQVAGSLQGKTLIDCTNPIARTNEGVAMAVGPESSGAEEIAKRAPGARVVKAFNTVYSQVIHEGARFGGENALLFYCGDDAQAKAGVAELSRDVGFDPIDIGALRMARFLEPFAVVVIQLQRLPGMNSNMALKLLRRPEGS